MMNNREYIIQQALEIDRLKNIIEEKDLKIAELVIRVSRAEGLLDKYVNYVKIKEGREFK